MGMTKVMMRLIGFVDIPTSDPTSTLSTLAVVALRPQCQRELAVCHLSCRARRPSQNLDVPSRGSLYNEDSSMLRCMERFSLSFRETTIRV